MGYLRPGRVKYVTNSSGGNIAHLAPVAQSGFVGQAIKQKAADPTAGLVNPAQIANGEDFLLIVKGEIEVPVGSISSPAKGDAVYITSGNALTKTSTSNTPFGRIAEIAGGRGTPTGRLRIDLDAKDSI